MFTPRVHFPAKYLPAIWEVLTRADQEEVRALGVSEATRQLLTVRWEDEPPELDEYFLFSEMVERGHDDCEGLAMAWAAIYREGGCRAHAERVLQGGEDHAIVVIDRYPDGAAPDAAHTRLDVSRLYHGMPL